MKAAQLLRPQIDGSFASVLKTKGEPAHPGHDQAPVYMMLLAFAAENFLKGILVGREPHRVGPVKLLKWEGGGHDLTALARVAGVKLNRNEKRLLLSLSVHGQWQGRYPCPLNHEDHLPRTTPGGGFAPLGGIYGSDLNLAVDLCARFKQILDDERARALLKKRAQQGAPADVPASRARG